MLNTNPLIDEEPDLNLDSVGPFGSPDASRVSFHQLKKSFVNLSNSNTKTDENLGADPSVRVIVGRRGSGKTLYLRSIQNYCRKLNADGGNSVYVTEIANQPPDTRLIVKITAWFEENEKDADEVWRKIWKLAVLRTIYTHVAFSDTFNQNQGKAFAKYITGQKNKLLEHCRPVLPTTQSPTSVFDQLTSILTKSNSMKDLQDYISLEAWVDFEYEIGQILSKCPPIYFFIDQLDDDFANAPFHWLKCQFGLFNAIFRFIRKDSFGGKLHIVVCIREVVYLYILQTPHGNKYLCEPKIKVLRWDKRLSRHFLDKKIESLNERYFVEKSKTKTAETFFGVDHVRLNRLGGMKEDIRSYLLRHTMLLPREIINIGNIFCEEQENIVSRAEIEQAVKSTVSRVAKSLARDQLKMASILISNRWIYNGAVEQGNFETYSDESMLNAINTNLCMLVLEIGKDRFSNEVFKRVNGDKAKYDFDEKDEPFTALFRAGLLGYVELDSDGTAKEIFFSESGNSQFHLPVHCREYVFHSCLIDHLGIAPVGGPVSA